MTLTIKKPLSSQKNKRAEKIVHMELMVLISEEEEEAVEEVEVTRTLMDMDMVMDSPKLKQPHFNPIH